MLFKEDDWQGTERAASSNSISALSASTLSISATLNIGSLAGPPPSVACLGMRRERLEAQSSRATTICERCSVPEGSACLAASRGRLQVR